MCGMELSPGHCRAARGLLNWSQEDLARRSEVTRRTIANFELSTKKANIRTIQKLLAAFEAAGIEFLNSDAPGLRLKSVASFNNQSSTLPTRDPSA
jgi:transcriptional regulator with XRE-family HTH domain